jgi:hypothetical protein
VQVGTAARNLCGRGERLRGARVAIAAMGVTAGAAVFASASFRTPACRRGESVLGQIGLAAQLQFDACLPGGTPLRPGTYYISNDWYGRLPTPTIAVPVVAATG